MTNLELTDGPVTTRQPGPRLSSEWVRWFLGCLLAAATFWYGFGNRVSVLETKQEALQEQFRDYRDRYNADRQDLKEDLRELNRKVDRVLEIQQKRQ